MVVGCAGVEEMQIWCASWNMATWRSYHVIVDAPREIGQVEFEAIHLLC